MTEVLFYHLEAHPLERVLPVLVERCLERGWRAVIQAGSDERRDALDQLLWTFSDAAFLPHGTSRDGFTAEQPVYLTAEGDNPNGSTVRFLVDRAEPGELGTYQRAVLIFDGNDADALADARRYWKQFKAAGLDLSYWKQDAGGRWQKKA
ncbi:MAG: DNA polymerase III subunit chi [Ancalomicrobiaceae bacterium]|nr:DNA polymerase III subunit chi [Ancalomicrobiaceae bacterium]